MYSFDEIALLGELKALPQRARMAFAAAAATRQLGNFERFARESGIGNERRPREIADQLWVALQLESIDRASWSTNLDEVTSLLPEEGDDWAICHALADDALSSLAYAIRCLLTPEPQEAAWAARRAYEAADQAAIRTLDLQPGSRAMKPRSRLMALCSASWRARPMTFCFCVLARLPKCGSRRSWTSC